MVSGHGEEHLPSEYISGHEEFDRESSKCGRYSVSENVIIQNFINEK